MVNIRKQVDYWNNWADEDIETADLLIREHRTLHGLFFCHLVIEKAIKAHVVQKIGDVAPRSHNLIYNPVLPNQLIVNEYLIKTKELLKWLKMKL